MSVSNPRRRAFLQARWNDAATSHSNSVARVESACLARHNVACELCRDACEHAAIRFLPRVPVAIPRIVTELCTGCGDCVSICPVGALVVPAGEERLHE